MFVLFYVTCSIFSITQFLVFSQRPDLICRHDFTCKASFGNNFNNRTEEALGTAMDIWTAYREGAFRTSPAPWIGYLLLLEDCPESRRPVGVREPHFPVFSEFVDASYSKRYELFCRKLIRERQYNSACFITADRKKADLEKNYAEPAKDLSANKFLASLLGHAASASNKKTNRPD